MDQSSNDELRACTSKPVSQKLHGALRTQFQTVFVFCLLTLSCVLRQREALNTQHHSSIYSNLLFPSASQSESLKKCPNREEVACFAPPCS